MQAEIPEEERPRAESYADLVRRLSRLSVTKHYDAFADVPWDAPEMRIDAADPRFELPADDGLGRTAWYRALPPETRARLGLTVIARSMKVGVQFENVLSRGLLVFAMQQPNRSPAFRYAYHEVIEESQHSLMFQEFVDRSGVEAGMLRGWRGKVGEHVPELARRFPELFFLFVLGGEDPIDYVQRTAIASGRMVHPLVRRISQIHITEEARHLCFARQYLRENVPRLGPVKRAALKALAPLVLSVMARAMLKPSAKLIAEFQIPDEVVREAWTENPEHRARMVASLAKVRTLCEELGILDERTRPVWRRLGIA